MQWILKGTENFSRRCWKWNRKIVTHTHAHTEVNTHHQLNAKLNMPSKNIFILSLFPFHFICLQFSLRMMRLYAIWILNARFMISTNDNINLRSIRHFLPWSSSHPFQHRDKVSRLPISFSHSCARKFSSRNFTFSSFPSRWLWIRMKFAWFGDESLLTILKRIDWNRRGVTIKLRQLIKHFNLGGLRGEDMRRDTANI